MLRSASVAAAGLVLLLCAGCPPRVRPGRTPILQPAPPEGAPTSRPAGGPEGGAQQLPLPATGHNSEEQLRAELSRLSDPGERAAFEGAFRLALTTERAARDVPRARGLLQGLLERGFAPAWRLAGFAYVSEGFQAERAIACYERAVELDPEYGMAHYALAFMLGQVDAARGRAHFERALALGVQDERDLRARFYGGR